MQRDDQPTTDAGRGVSTSREQIPGMSPKAARDLQREGWQAGWDGQPSTACPFRWTEDEPEQYHPVKAEMWLAGWAAAQTDLRVHREDTPQAERDAHGKPGRF